MNRPALKSLFVALQLSVAACQCEPQKVYTCDAAKCAGICRNGMCISSAGGGLATGGGSATAGGGNAAGGSAAGGFVSAGGAATAGGFVSAGGSATAGGFVSAGGSATAGGFVSAGGSATAGGFVSAGGVASGGGVAAAGGAAGGFFVDFDGGWQIQVPPPNPALDGGNSTTQHLGPGANASSTTAFGGPLTGTGPTVVYPADGVIFPPNTNRIEFHFLPSSGQTLFRFTFRAPSRTVEVFTTCTAVGGGCVFSLEGAAYNDLIPSARGTAPVVWNVAGVNGASPGVVGVSPPQHLSFTEQDIIGGLYYWNTAGTVMRFDYGFPNAPAQTYLTGANVGALTCVGCHVISRQGNLIAVGKDIPAPSAYSTLRVATKQVATSTGGPLTGSANFFSFSPDEQHLLQSNGSSIQWRDLRTGVLRNVNNQGAMPDWSPSGASMVFARPGFTIGFPAPGVDSASLQTMRFTIGFPAPGVDSASLQTMRFNGTGFDPPTTLVPAGGQNNYYPAYSPDGRFVLFNRSPSNRNSMDNATVTDAGVPDGQLWTVPSTGGAPVHLINASAPGGTSWPKWAPVLHRYSGGTVMWLTFSSGRGYGLRLTDNQRTQLWMVAFDPAKAMLGQDPSFPAFWLPFQSITSGNHIGQWSTTVPRGPCTGTGQSTCAVGEVCRNGMCQPG